MTATTRDTFMPRNEASRPLDTIIPGAEMLHLRVQNDTLVVWRH
jgi:hypothetical protein